MKNMWFCYMFCFRDYHDIAEKMLSSLSFFGSRNCESARIVADVVWWVHKGALYQVQGYWKKISKDEIMMFGYPLVI